MKEIVLRNGDVQVLVNEDTSGLVTLESLGGFGRSFMPPEGMYKQAHPKTSDEQQPRHFAAVGRFRIEYQNMLSETHIRVRDVYHFRQSYEWFPKDMLVFPKKEGGS